MARAAAATAIQSKPLFTRFLAAIGRGIVASVESNSRLRTVQHLQAKTDAELADIGLKRDDIVRHVYGDLFYV